MITGGARIGRSVALSLARAGAANFLLTYNRSKSIIEETADELKKLGVHVIAQSMDATNESDVRQALDIALKNFGAIFNA